MTPTLTRKTAVFYSLLMLLTAGVFFAHLLHLRAAHAQSVNSNGVCKDPWLNDLIPARKKFLCLLDYDKFGINIDGIGVQGECNPKLYNNGSWRSETELQGYVDSYMTHRTVGVCRDPLLTQTLRSVWGRAPRGYGEVQDCNMYLYNGGSWSSGSQLTSVVSAQKTDLAKSNLDWSGGGLIRPNNPTQVVQPLVASVVGTVSGSVSTFYFAIPSSIISQDGNGIVAAGGGNIILNGGGNIVAAGGGNIVAAGGGNIILNGGGNYHTLAVGPGIPAKVVKAGSAWIIIPAGK